MNNDQAIAALEARMDSVELRTTRNELAIEKMNSVISDLRAAIGTVATKDDILKLSQNIDEKFAKQLTEARNSIPGKLAIIFSSGMFLLTFASFILAHLKG